MRTPRFVRAILATFACFPIEPLSGEEVNACRVTEARNHCYRVSHLEPHAPYIVISSAECFTPSASSLRLSWGSDAGSSSPPTVGHQLVLFGAGWRSRLITDIVVRKI